MGVTITLDMTKARFIALGKVSKYLIDIERFAQKLV